MITIILTLIFVTLQLTHNIDWSWWWVLSPLWITASLWVATFTVALALALAGCKKVRFKLNLW